MNSNNSVPVKLGYYVLFFILITIKISIIVLLYGYINKKKIGTAFDTHLENTLTTENVLFSDKPDVKNIIHPSFIDVYKKNISDENKLLKDTKYKKYVVSIDKIEIFGLKFLALALCIMLVSLKNQEYIEDFTNEAVDKLGNMNVLIIVIILVILFAMTVSVYLFIKFMKMKKILSINKDDGTDLLFLKQGLLYEPITNVIVNEKPDISDDKIVNIKKILTETGEKYDGDVVVNDIKNDNIIKFFNSNKTKHLPAPFNGGDNIYGEIYKTTAHLGIIISGFSIIISIISLIVIYKRGK
jgi:hypothetical protein